MTSPSLHDRLRDTVDHLSRIAPPELFGVFGAEQQRLAATADPTAYLQVGDTLPAGVLLDGHGVEVAVPGDLPAVIIFYRGAWCPYCNVALNAYQREVLPELRARNVSLIAISPQGPDGSAQTRNTNELTFEVLTDAGSAYARRIGITFDLTEDVKAAQLAFGNDFTTINAGGEWSLPKPTVLVVDGAGIVRLVDVRADYTERTEPAAILEAVRALS